MTKWYGTIGFSQTIETEPGLWEERVVEKPYFGDLMSNRWKRQGVGEINDNINIGNQISIVADPYALNHVSSMSWIEFQGEKWKVTDVEVQYPRLIINFGGVWNGK